MQTPEARTHESLLVDITARQLRAFVTVAERLSYVEAAKLLHYTEPGVFAQVKRLETLLMHKLFERTGRGVQLSMAGAAFLESCRETLAEFDRIEALSRRLADDRHVAVAAGVATGSYLLPALLRRFARAHPRIVVDLLTFASPPEVMGAVAAGAADLGACAGLNRLPLPAHLSLTHWLDEPHVLYGSTDSALPASTATVYLLPRSAELIDGIRQHLEGAGLRDYELRSVDSTDAVKGACAAGLGYAFLPRRAVQLEVQAGMLTEVHSPNGSFTAHVGICHPHNEAWAADARTLLHFLLASDTGWEHQ